jgi:hypothetical protein
MNMSTYLNLDNLAIGFSISLTLFTLLLALRSFWCWYLRLSQMVGLLRGIQDELHMLNASMRLQAVNTASSPKRETQPSRSANERGTTPREIALEKPAASWPAAALVPMREEVRLEPMGSNVFVTQNSSPVVIPFEEYVARNAAGKIPTPPMKKKLVQTGDRPLPCPLPPL